jgi:hypothetical protein
MSKQSNLVSTRANQCPDPAQTGDRVFLRSKVKKKSQMPIFMKKHFLELSKTKQIFLIFASLVVLVAYQVWRIPDRPADVLLAGAIVALTLCTAVIAMARRWDKPAYFDWSIAGYLAVMTLLLFAKPDQAKFFLRNYSEVGIYGSFLIATFFPPLFGLPPFTFHYVRKKIPQAYWYHPVVTRISLITNFVWTVIFCVSMLMSFIRSPLFQFLIPNLLILGFGVPFSSCFSAFYLRRYAGTLWRSSVMR